MGSWVIKARPQQMLFGLRQVTNETDTITLSAFHLDLVFSSNSHVQHSSKRSSFLFVLRKLSIKAQRAQSPKSSLLWAISESSVVYIALVGSLQWYTRGIIMAKKGYSYTSNIQ